MYADLIRRIDPTINSVGVECSMRLQYGTLDHLDDLTFRAEVQLARACEQREPGFLQKLAASYGRRDEYNAEQATLRRARTGAGERTDEE